MVFITHAAAQQSVVSSDETSGEASIVHPAPLSIDSDEDTNKNRDNMNLTVNPQIWKFQQYGHHSSALYTGTLNLKIPVYTYKDPDFEIPVSLDYASNGYKPNNQAASVGLGWFLNAGGYITRENVGMRDDKTDGLAGEGFLYYHTKEAPSIDQDTMIYAYCYSNKYRYDVGYFGAPGQTMYETTPDIHTFCFLNHYGKFSMGFFNSTYVYNTNHVNGEYSVNLSEYQSGDNAWWQQGSQITITTGDGYQYRFTRDDVVSRYEFYVFEGNAMKFKFLGTPKNYWPLTSITAPNGRTVTFEYGEVEYNDNVHYDVDKYTDDASSLINGMYAVREYVRQLKAIRVGDMTISFQYGPRHPEKVHSIRYDALRTSAPATLRTLKKLDAIKVSVKDHLLKTCTLCYDYSPDKDNPVLFLSKVRISGEGTYTMDYYDKDSNFPKHATTHFDHWGYYNNPSCGQLQVPNRYGLNSEIPAVTIDGNNVETVISNNREPNFYGARRGMLERLTYPTGGFSKYYYESHSCDAVVTRDLTADHKNLPYLKRLPQERLVGGVRIRRIANYKNLRDSTFKEYSYSRGILLHLPRYGQYQTNRVTGQREYVAGTGNRITYTADKTHIEYPYVRESLSDGSYTDYTFSNYRTVPDEHYDYMHVYNPATNQITEASYSQNLMAEPHSLAGQRGRLLSRTTYDNKNAPIKSYRMEYDYGKQLPYHPTVKNGIDLYVSRMYTDDYPLVAEIEETYPHDGEEIAISKRMITYNGRGQKETTTLQDVKDSVIYMYSKSIGYLTANNVVRHIRNKNMLQLPWERYKMVKLRGKYYFTDATRYSYALYGGIPCLASVEKAKIDKPQSPEKELEFRNAATYKYDDLGHLIFANESGDMTSYIWGYGGLYPVAEIKGAGLSRVQQIQGLKTIHLTPLPGELNPEQEKALRQIEDASVRTFKYQPQVGMSELRDPANRATYFEYNENGKLFRIKNQELRLLNQYEYSSDKQ